MSALAKVVDAEVPSIDAADDVLIHVRFAPSAEIFTIDGQPEGMDGKTWYELLLNGASQHYRTLAGGRGFFRIPRPTYDAILASAGK